MPFATSLWTIYKITNPNGKLYIGVTSNLSRRLQVYKSASCFSQPLLLKSLKKYGFGQHDFLVLETFFGTNKNAFSKEMFWIRSYMSNTSKYRELNIGLNLTDGGQGTIGYRLTDKQKAKISERNTGMKHSEEARRKIGLASRGNTHNMGRKQSDEWVANMSRLHKGNRYNKGKKQTPDRIAHRVSFLLGKKHSAASIEKMRQAKISKKGKPILQFNKEGILVKEYPAICEAARQTGICLSSIKQVLRGRFKQIHSFTFKYKISHAI